jgi:hypothetical protein
VSNEEIKKRHCVEIGKYQSVLLSNDFNAELRYFYRHIANDIIPQMQIICLDGSLEKGVTLTKVINIIEETCISHGLPV